MFKSSRWIATLALVSAACTNAAATLPATTTTTTVPVTTTTSTQPVMRPAPVPPDNEGPARITHADSSQCGNNLPPCSVCMRESRCTYGIISNGGCSGWNCYGKWQFDPTTWRAVVHRYGLTGIPDWPPTSWAQVTPAMEDAVAAALWANGAGCGHWAAC